MNVAITGATGLIGSALIRAWLAQGRHAITALTRQDPAALPRGERLAWLQGNLSDADTALRLVQGQDLIVHLANDSVPLAGGGDLAADAMRNLLPSLKLIDAIGQAGGAARVVFLSSGGAVYGASPNRRPFPETHRCEPGLLYGAHKLAVENYLRVAATRRTLSAVVLRVANAYGGELPPDRMQGIIGTSVARVRAGQPLRLVGSPDNIRDYVHVDDVVDAIDRAASSDTSFDIFNIGSGVGTSTIDVLERIQAAAPAPTRIITEDVSGSQWLPSWCVLDVSKAAGLLGWKPSVSLEQGIQGMF